MAVAAADFSTSIDSTSFGLRSARRLTVWSWLEFVEPLERESAARPPCTDWFETITPSTT